MDQQRNREPAGSQYKNNFINTCVETAVFDRSNTLETPCGGFD
jgi:hypothetical protein